MKHRSVAVQLFVASFCLVACGRADRAVVVPESTAASNDDEHFGESPCPEPHKGDAEHACLHDDVAQCCTVASIPYEYEMLESRSHGDMTQAQTHRDQMLEILSHGCDLGDGASCEELEVQVGAGQ